MKTLNFEEMEMVEGGSLWGGLACGILGAMLDAGMFGSDFGYYFRLHQDMCPY
jgi:lactobin A/cerein 7B family class IIb bacteriocin